MNKLLMTVAMLWAVFCFAAPSVVINSGSMRYSGNAHILVNNGMITNADTGTPFYAQNTKNCSSSTTFYGPEGSLDALVITPAGDMGSTEVHIYSGSYHPNTSTSVVQWWNIIPTTDQACSLEFRFRNSYLDVLDLAELAIWEYSGDWVKISENITSSNVGTAFTSITFGAVSFAGSKGSHQIILADKADQTLPLELSSFNASTNFDGRVTLSWLTHSESGMRGFYVWRSQDEFLENAELISNLIDATNTSTTQNYIFSESSMISSGIWYYWLQAVNMDGSERFYGSLQVEVDNPNPETPSIPIKTGISSTFPNPFNPNLNIKYSLATTGVSNISILNVKGQVVRNLQNKKLAVGDYSIQWDGRDNEGSSCASGVYFVRMSIDKEQYYKRAVLMK